MRWVLVCFVAGCSSGGTFVLNQDLGLGEHDLTPAEILDLSVVQPDMETVTAPDMLAGQDLTPVGDMTPPPDLFQCLDVRTPCSGAAQCCSVGGVASGCQDVSAGGTSPAVCCLGWGAGCASPNQAYCCDTPIPSGYVDFNCKLDPSNGTSLRCCAGKTQPCPTDASKRQRVVDCGEGPRAFGTCFF